MSSGQETYQGGSIDVPVGHGQRYQVKLSSLGVSSVNRHIGSRIRYLAHAEEQGNTHHLDPERETVGGHIHKAGVLKATVVQMPPCFTVELFFGP